jgi:hypothetical protein
MRVSPRPSLQDMLALLKLTSTHAPQVMPSILSSHFSLAENAPLLTLAAWSHRCNSGSSFFNCSGDLVINFDINDAIGAVKLSMGSRLDGLLAPGVGSVNRQDA